jgi:hypothetical protein
MLIRNFYDNHTFYQCEYDPNIFINLNGKVLEFKNKQFVTYLGFRNILNFNVIDEGMRQINNEIQIKVINLDNVIDENFYNQISSGPSTSSKKDNLKRQSNKDDYTKYFSSLIKNNEDLKEVEVVLKELVDKLQNNFILIKGHVETYKLNYQKLVNEFNDYLNGKLSKFKQDDSFNTIIKELTESLIFSKLYQFLYMNIKNFNADDEIELKNTINSLKSEFNFTMPPHKLDAIFNECKFKNAIAELKKINGLHAPFEKIVNDIITY